MLTGGMEQTIIIDQGSSWTEIISTIAAVAAVVIPLLILGIKRGKAKN